MVALSQQEFLMDSTSNRKPGMREQHLLRKQDNPLFDGQEPVTPQQLAEARLSDDLERDRFVENFTSLVRRAAELNPNTPSETILEIKEELDRSYQQACALPGDQKKFKDAIRKLVKVIMDSVWKGVTEDQHAQQQLRDEQFARDMHFQLQEVPLVSALTHPNSPITEDELIPTVLSEPLSDLAMALQVFDENQIEVLYSDAGAFLHSKDPERKLADAWERLTFIGSYLRKLRPDVAANQEE
jgi:hypothetical protein